jgi:hypothetical protein
MSLSKAGMLVKLTRNSWYGFSKDNSATEAAKTAAGATATDAGSFNKRLLPKEALKPVRNVENKIYSKHCELTVPWYFNGVDFLPSKLFLNYTEVMRALKDEHAVAVTALVAQYPVFRANRAKELGSMFKVEDYPPPDVLKASFNIDIKFMPVPDAADFRIDLEKEELEKLQKDLGRDLTNAQSQAMRTIWARVMETLDHVYDRLSDPERIFRDSLLDNALQLSELLPGFNITGDSRMDLVAKGISSDICKYSADTLRTDPDARLSVANAARALKDVCEGAVKEIV